jgi:hypothetical protein
MKKIFIIAFLFFAINSVSFADILSSFKDIKITQAGVDNLIKLFPLSTDWVEWQYVELDESQKEVTLFFTTEDFGETYEIKSWSIKEFGPLLLERRQEIQLQDLEESFPIWKIKVDKDLRFTMTTSKGTTIRYGVYDGRPQYLILENQFKKYGNKIGCYFEVSSDILKEVKKYEKSGEFSRLIVYREIWEKGYAKIAIVCTDWKKNMDEWYKKISSGLNADGWSKSNAMGAHYQINIANDYKQKSYRIKSFTKPCLNDFKVVSPYTLVPSIRNVAGKIYEVRMAAGRN